MRRRSKNAGLQPWAALGLGFVLCFVSPPSTAAAPPRASKPIAKPEQTHIVDQTAVEARRHARARRSSNSRRRTKQSNSIDASRVPRMSHPTVHRRASKHKNALLGWSGALAEPRTDDRRRRIPPAELPRDYVIGVGERLAFDVYFAGNPVGLAEAEVTGFERDPRGEAPQGAGRFEITGHAVTSGVLSLLSAMEDTMVTHVDQKTGAAIHNHNVVNYQGIGSKYKHRVTDIEFEGRGNVRIIDEKDGKVRKLTRKVPRDIFDPLSAMAWVRSLQLADGERATAHVMDGPRLLRVEVVGRGKKVPEVVPNIATALGVSPSQIVLLEGTLTRVDKYDEPIPEKRAYAFRAYMTQDDRNLILSIETDMWLGVLRLILSEYQPPHGRPLSPEPAPEPGPQPAAAN